MKIKWGKSGHRLRSILGVYFRPVSNSFCVFLRVLIKLLPAIFLKILLKEPSVLLTVRNLHLRGTTMVSSALPRAFLPSSQRLLSSLAGSTSTQTSSILRHKLGQLPANSLSDEVKKAMSLDNASRSER